MSLIFEEIKPWDGSSGTGAEARAVLKRNFDKIIAAFQNFTPGTGINLEAEYTIDFYQEEYPASPFTDQSWYIPSTKVMNVRTNFYGTDVWVPITIANNFLYVFGTKRYLWTGTDMLMLSDSTGGTSDSSFATTYITTPEAIDTHLTPGPSGVMLAADYLDWGIKLFSLLTMPYAASTANFMQLAFCFTFDAANDFSIRARWGTTINAVTGWSDWETLAGGTSTSSTITTVSDTGIVVGGIPIHTDLRGKTLDEFADMLCNPELWPTLTAPSTTFTITPSATYQKVGAVVDVVPAQTFSRGTISPAYGTSGFRSGALVDYTTTGTFGDVTIVLGAQSWTSKANYAVGEQPKGSKGTNYLTPLAAGSTAVITRTITGVYPLFATTVAIATLTELSLQAHGSDVAVTMAAESGANKQTVQIPQAWGTIGVLQQFNTLSGTWDAIDLASFTKTSVTISGTLYWQYTHNGSTIGSRQLKFKI